MIWEFPVRYLDQAIPVPGAQSARKELTVASPHCPQCQSTSITWSTSTQNGVSGFFVYCSSCGAIITWVPQPR